VGVDQERKREKEMFFVGSASFEAGVSFARSAMWESTERERERESFVLYRIVRGFSDGGVSCLQCNVRVDLGEEAVDVVAQAHHLSARVSDGLDRSEHRIKVRHLYVYLCIHIHI